MPPDCSGGESYSGATVLYREMDETSIGSDGGDVDIVDGDVEIVCD